MLSPSSNTMLQKEEHSLFIQETQTQLPARLKPLLAIRHAEDEDIPTRRSRKETTTTPTPVGTQASGSLTIVK